MREYEAYTKEQQQAYENLVERQRLYVEFRVRGYTKVESYALAGYKSDKIKGQGAYKLEAKKPILKELIEARRQNKLLSEVLEGSGEVADKVDLLAKASTKKGGVVLDLVDKANKDTLEQIKFYRDIINGNTKTKKIITTIDAYNRKTVRTEEIEDVGQKMIARERLDRILGIKEMISVGEIGAGEVKIMIVDASKKEVAEDNEVLGTVIEEVIDNRKKDNQEITEG